MSRFISALPKPSIRSSFVQKVRRNDSHLLPVATPPKAIVYVTEQVSQATMMRCGLVLNLVCIAAIAAVATCVFA